MCLSNLYVSLPHPPNERGWWGEETYDIQTSLSNKYLKSCWSGVVLSPDCALKNRTKKLGIRGGQSINPNPARTPSYWLPTVRGKDKIPINQLFFFTVNDCISRPGSVCRRRARGCGNDMEICCEFQCRRRNKICCCPKPKTTPTPTPEPKTTPTPTPEPKTTPTPTPEPSVYF